MQEKNQLSYISIMVFLSYSPIRLINGGLKIIFVVFCTLIFAIIHDVLRERLKTRHL